MVSMPSTPSSLQSGSSHTSDVISHVVIYHAAGSGTVSAQRMRESHELTGTPVREPSTAC